MTVIRGGAHGKSSEVGFSKSLNILRPDLVPVGNWKALSWWWGCNRCGGGDPGISKLGVLRVGDGVSMVNVGMTKGGTLLGLFGWSLMCTSGDERF